MKIFLIVFLLIPVSLFAKTVVFMGDSLTEGYQLSKEEAYPALIEKELKKDHPDIKIINGGVSGATSASGAKRLDWYLKAKPDVMVLALGANDGLRGLKVADTEKNLSSVIEKANTRGIKVILAGMKMPTNYGESYRKEFEAMFVKVAKKYKLKFIPFILEGVGGKPELNLADGIHPNAKGHEIMARTVLKVLEPEL
ncbi:MAG TPA: arylesterase [Bacteriovoracaceae bacterium]|nr:arylesterase [Bacteriovoracaceae bacterium]